MYTDKVRIEVYHIEGIAPQHLVYSEEQQILEGAPFTATPWVDVATKLGYPGLADDLVAMNKLVSEGYHFKVVLDNNSRILSEY